MEFFNKNLLDNQTIERVEATLDSLQRLVSEYTVLPQFRELASEYMAELLEYYNNRVMCESQYIDCRPLKANDLPF